MATQVKTQASSTEEAISNLPSLNYLMSLSECLWEKATEVAGPGITALFRAHADLEWIVDVVEGRRKPDANPEGFHREAMETIQGSWSLFGHGLPEAMEDYLAPGTPVYPTL